MRAERRPSDADTVISLLRCDDAVERLPVDAKISELLGLLPDLPSDEELAGLMSHGSEDEERQILHLFMRTRL